MSGGDPSDLFRQEARDLLDGLEQTLLDLERTPDDGGLIDAAFRALHTIKGSGAMFGFDAVAGFVHEFETAFDRVRKGRAQPNPALVRVALSALDHVHQLIFTPGASAEAGAPILAALAAAVEGADAPAHPATTAQTVQPAEPASAASPAGAQGLRVTFRLPADALATGANPVLLLDELRELGPCTLRALTDTVPTLEALDPEVLHIGWEVAFETDVPTESIEDVFMFMRDDMELAIEPLAPVSAEPAAQPDAEPEPQQVQAAPPAPHAARPAAPVVALERAAAKPDTSLRVSAERLDELMDRVGELVVAQARLNQIAGTSRDPALKAIAEEMERLAAGLRDTTMGIRMVPIGTLFGRFRRVVHDLSHSLGKEVEFVTSGEETELDKTMIERLADPLVHLIRNAMDHGLEAPARRAAAGKPLKGAVRLSAVHVGAEVAISISDDGAGLDSERIRAKAEEAGLLAPGAIVADHDLYQFLFHPGFSTAREITSVSGRGVGMDVVKKTIEGLRGTIELSTLPGRGTTATLRLPLTLAIIDGMLVRVGAGRYTIPLSAVEECVELPPEAEVVSNGRNFLNIRGALVPFLRLRELFATPGEAPAHPKVVIVSAGDLRVGLVVDQIIGNNQTVIKSLSKLHADVKTFSGASILGDGTVSLILDVGNLVGFGQAFEDRLRGERLGRAA